MPEVGYYDSIHFTFPLLIFFVFFPLVCSGVTDWQEDGRWGMGGGGGMMYHQQVAFPCWLFTRTPLLLRTTLRHMRVLLCI